MSKYKYRLSESSNSSRNRRSVSSEDEAHPYSMTEQILMERSGKINKGRYITQLYAGVTVSLGAVCFGLVIGWSGPAIRLRLDTNESYNKSDILDKFSSIAYLAPLGCCLGTLMISILTYRNGPRNVMLVLSPIQGIMWVILSMEIRILQRVLIFFSGFCSIGFLICGEILLRDAVHIGHIHYLYIMFRTSITVGILISYVFGLMGTWNRYYSALSTVINILQFVSLYFCKESPVYLYERNIIQAEESLKFYRGATNIHEEMRQIKHDSENRIFDSSLKYMFLKRVVYKALFRIGALYFFQAFSGYYAFIAYGTTIFKPGKALNDPDYFGKISDAAIIGTSYCFASFIGNMINYNIPYGIRRLLIISISLMTVSLFSLFIYFLTIQYSKHKVLSASEHGWIYYILVASFVISYELALSTYPDFILFDYLPHQVYHLSKTMADSFKWMIVVIMIRCTFILQYQMHTYGVLLMLGVVSLIGTVFCALFVIESKGKTLLQIQMEIGGNPVGSRSLFKTRYKNIFTQHPAP